MSIEVEVPQTTISNKAIEVEYSNSNTAIAEGTKDLEVTVNRREYSIVGDELYIPKRYEDAPQWLRDIIDTVTNAAISGAISDVSTLGDMLTGLIAELNVAKNTYTMSIISDNSINERINTAIETLNSSLADADSTILDIAMTRVTPEEAQTIALGILSASICGGDISAAVQNLQSAIADVDSARALDYTRLNASIGDEFESTATAISTINAYVGIDEAGASTGTGLSAYLEDSNGVIGGADSQLNNTIKVTAEGIESKFEYNSMVNINGVYKKSGFGLTTNYTSGSGTEANPYVSEFWIDASRLKFTNSNVTGQTAPFTIDASGTTPQITFNGKVAFTNVTGTSSLALTDMSNVTTIDGGKIVTNTLYGDRLIGNTVSADKLTSSTGTSTTWTGGGLVSQNFNGNVSGSIGSPTQGFRLSSNAVGTSTDPNIYGAYIKGATMDSTSIKVVSVTDSSKSGNVFYSKTAISPAAYGSSYGSGYLPDRVCNPSSIIEILASFSITTGENANNTNVLEYSIDSEATWVILDSKNYVVSGGVALTTLPIFLFGTLYGSSIGANTYVVFRVRTTSGNTAVNKRIKLAIYNS